MFFLLELPAMMQKDIMGLAMENNTAFVYDNGKQYFMKSTPNANAFFIQYKGDVIEKQEIIFEEV